MPALPTTGSVIHKVQGGAQYTTGTTQATDGQTVATLVDTGGSTRNVAQATGAIQPTFKTGSGFDANLVRFALKGTNRPFMGLEATTPSDRAGMTIFLVHRTVYHVSNQQMPISPGGTGVHGSFYWDHGAPYSNVAGSAIKLTDALTPGCNKMVTAIRCGAGGLATVWRNLNKSSVTASIGTGTSTGGLLSAFNSGGGVWPCSQDLWDFRMYAAEYTDLQMSQYIQQLMSDNNIAPSIGRIIFDGDSIMAGHSIGSASVWTSENDVPPTQITARLRARGLPHDTWNVAIASQTVSSLVTNFPSYVMPRNGAAAGIPSTYVIHVGTNDVSNGSSAQTVYDAIRALVATAKAQGMRVIVSTLLYKYAESAALNQVRDALNTLLRNGWTSFCDGLADVADYSKYPQLLNSDANASRATYFETSTNIHPTSAGGAIMAVEFDRAFAAMYSQLTPSRSSVIPVDAGALNRNGSLAGGWADAISAGGYGVDAPAAVLLQPGTQISRFSSKIIRRPAGMGNTLVFREKRPVGITSVDVEPGFVLFGRRSGSGDAFEPIKNFAGNAAIVVARNFSTDLQDDARAYAHSVPAAASKAYVAGYDEFIVGQTASAVANGADTSLCSLQVRLSDTYPTS